MMRTLLRSLAAVLVPLTLAAPAALPAQAVGVGLGFGLGTRTGFVLSAGVQVMDAVQLVCKLGGVPMAVASVSCGTHLYVFDDPDRFAVLEVGRLDVGHPQPVDDGSWLFVQGGLGLKDHEVPDENDDGVPEYPEWFNASWAAGVTLVFAKVREEMVTGEDGRPTLGRRTLTRSLWPLFFLDAQAELYFPGRDCAKC
jgi:hypothetical protein